MLKCTSQGTVWQMERSLIVCEILACLNAVRERLRSIKGQQHCHWSLQHDEPPVVVLRMLLWRLPGMLTGHEESLATDHHDWVKVIAKTGVCVHNNIEQNISALEIPWMHPQVRLHHFSVSHTHLMRTSCIDHSKEDFVQFIKPETCVSIESLSDKHERDILSHHSRSRMTQKSFFIQLMCGKMIPPQPDRAWKLNISIMEANSQYRSVNLIQIRKCF